MNSGAYQQEGAFYRRPDRDDWETPHELFNRLNEEFGFTLDVCATAANAKCARFLSPVDDALTQEWVGICWMNPPYGNQIARWIKKAKEEADRGATVVALLAARTDTGWWHDYVMKAAEVRFLRGRVRFQGAPAPAPFPSAIVVFRKGDRDGTSCRRLLTR